MYEFDAPRSGATKGLRNDPDRFGALPTEHLESRGILMYAAANVLEVTDAIVTSTVALVPRTSRVPNYAVSRVYANGIWVRHQNRCACGIVREEIVLAIKNERRRSVGIQRVDVRGRRCRSRKRSFGTVRLICGVIQQKVCPTP